MITKKTILIFFILGIVTSTFLIGEYFTPTTEQGTGTYYQATNITFSNNEYSYLLWNGENFIIGFSDFEVKEGDIISSHTITDTLHIPILYEGRSWYVLAKNNDIIESEEIKYYSYSLIFIYIATFISYAYPYLKGRKENKESKP